MGLLLFSGYRPVRTFPKTDTAPGTFFGINPIGNQRLADPRGTLFLIYMDIVFVSKISQGGKHWIGRCFAQGAQAGFTDGPGQVFQKINLFRPSAAFGDIGHDFKHSVNAEAAWDAFSAGFVLKEGEKVFGHVDHAGVFIHDHDTA